MPEWGRLLRIATVPSGTARPDPQIPDIKTRVSRQVQRNIPAVVHIGAVRSAASTMATSILCRDGTATQIIGVVRPSAWARQRGNIGRGSESLPRGFVVDGGGAAGAKLCGPVSIGQCQATNAP